MARPAAICLALLLGLGACGRGPSYELTSIAPNEGFDWGDPFCDGDGDAHLMKLSAHDGVVAWRTRVPVPRQNDLYYPSIKPSGPVVVIETVFPVGLVALDAEDGTPVWQAQTDEYMAEFHPVRDGLGIVEISGHESSVRALDPRFGTELWASEPREISVHYQHQVFVSGETGAVSAPGGTRGFSVRTGVETWMSPVWPGIFGGTATSGVAAFEMVEGFIAVLDLSTGEELWTTGDVPTEGGGFTAAAGDWVAVAARGGIDVRHARSGELVTRIGSEDLAAPGPRSLRVESSSGSVPTIRFQANDLVGSLTLPNGLPRVVVDKETATLVTNEATWSVDPFSGLSDRPRSRGVLDAAVGEGAAYVSVAGAADSGRVQGWSLEDGSLLWEVTTDDWVYEITLDGTWLYLSESCSRLYSD